SDNVFNFTSGTDKVHLDASVMNALGASGNFSAGDARFYSAPGATSGHDADDRVVYDSTNGNLWYDADGSGAQAAQLVAHLSGGGLGAARASVGGSDGVVADGPTPSSTSPPRGTTSSAMPAASRISAPPAGSAAAMCGSSPRLAPRAGTTLMTGSCTTRRPETSGTTPMALAQGLRSS